MQIITDRRALHQIPEVQWDLPKTAAYLTESLKKLSCQVFSPKENAVCAWFDFGADRTIAFRSDMDALPIAEQTGLAFASRHPGYMHACGHDGHMAILLELARRLDAKRTLDKNVLLIFQPAEESPGGAKILCDTGLLESYRAEAVFGLHLWPEVPEGRIASRRGPMMSRSSEVTVEFTGKSSHIARADRGIDAMAAAVEFYCKAMALEKTLPQEVFRLLKFGKLQSGTARNAISCHTRLEGTLRTFDDGVFDTLRQGLQDIVRQVQEHFGCQISLHMSDGYPAVCNDDGVYDRVCAIADIMTLDVPSMISEDFSWYQKHVPGVLVFLGVGDTPSLHASNFTFNEEVLSKGADFFEKLAIQY